MQTDDRSMWQVVAKKDKKVDGTVWNDKHQVDGTVWTDEHHCVDN